MLTYPSNVEWRAHNRRDSRLHYHEDYAVNSHLCDQTLEHLQLSEVDPWYRFLPNYNVQHLCSTVITHRGIVADNQRVADWCSLAAMRECMNANRKGKVERQNEKTIIERIYIHCCYLWRYLLLRCDHTLTVAATYSLHVNVCIWEKKIW